MATFDTAGNIIRDAAVELGLLSGSYTDDPFASTNENTLILVRLLKSLGQELVGEHEWSQLRREWEQVTTVAVGEYPLPAGWDREVNQTAWDVTNQIPLGGPISAQHRQLIKARTSTGVVMLPYHILGNTFFLEPAPSVPDAHTIRREYISEYWVAASGDTVTTKAAPTLQSDELWFGRQLLVKGLKYRFLEAKGFDTTASGAAYARELGRAIGASEPSPVLRLDGGSFDEPLISARNIPDTGYGL